MSFFDPETDGQDLALHLMLKSFVCLFWRPALLHETVGWFRDHGYRIVELDASTWHTDADMHRAFADTLDFPDCYGHNLDALNDCLGDFDAGPDVTGLVFVFTGYDTFARACPREAQIVLDIIADLARRAMLTGHRVCCLVQSDDPDIVFEPVGAAPVLWNDAEWLNSNRRPDS
jgi:hypothetical protein